MGNEPTPLGLDISLGRNLTASDVVCILNDLIQTSRRPVCLLGGSGSELISSAVKEWLLDKYVDTHHIGLGSPWHNGYCECADSMLRASYLDKLMFGSDDQGTSSLYDGGRTTIPSGRTYDWPA